MLLMGAPRATALRCLHALGPGSCKSPAGALLIQLCIPGTRQAAWQAVGVQNNLLNDRMIFFFFSRYTPGLGRAVSRTETSCTPPVLGSAHPPAPGPS